MSGTPQPLWISSQANLPCFGREGKRDAKSKNAQVGFNWSLEWFSNEIFFKWRVKTIHVKVEPNQSTFFIKMICLVTRSRILVEANPATELIFFTHVTLIKVWQKTKVRQEWESLEIKNR